MEGSVNSIVWLQGLYPFFSIVISYLPRGNTIGFDPFASAPLIYNLKSYTLARIITTPVLDCALDKSYTKSSLGTTNIVSSKDSILSPVTEILCTPSVRAKLPNPSKAYLSLLSTVKTPLTISCSFFNVIVPCDSSTLIDHTLSPRPCIVIISQAAIL